MICKQSHYSPHQALSDAKNPTQSPSKSRNEKASVKIIKWYVSYLLPHLKFKFPHVFRLLATCFAKAPATYRVWFYLANSSNQCHIIISSLPWKTRWIYFFIRRQQHGWFYVIIFSIPCDIMSLAVSWLLLPGTDYCVLHLVETSDGCQMFRKFFK